VYGISGIAKLLGCSKTMVHEYRKKGWIEPAIKQYGRKIVCDARLALELFGKRK
jgi:DNA-binding transcriptional MerR regulator